MGTRRKVGNIVWEVRLIVNTPPSVSEKYLRDYLSSLSFKMKEGDDVKTVIEIAAVQTISKQVMYVTEVNGK